MELISQAAAVDLAILDPDYQDWANLLERGILDKVLAVLKPTGNLLCFTKQPFDFALRTAVDPIFRREIIWSFENGGAWVSNKMPLVSFQKIYWCAKGNFYFDPHTGQDYAPTTKAMKRRSKVFEGYKAAGHEYTPSENGTWLRDHYHENKPAMGSIPAKPLNLAKILVKCFCPEGGLVLDMFGGSGTFAEAAQLLNRESISFEIKPDLVEQALTRLNSLRQIKMV